MDKALEDIRLEHVERNIAERADDTADHEPRVLALALFLAAEGDPGADRSHQEFGHKRNEAVDKIVPAKQRVIEHRAETCRKAAQHRAKEHAGEQAHGVREVHLRAQKREAEERHDADERRHDCDKYDLIG